MRKILLPLLAATLLISCGTNPSWTNLGPGVGGRLSAIVASPTDPNTLLVSSPGGGIWRTNNNGATWVRPLGYSLADYTVVDLQWDKIRSGRVLASTFSDVYASTDMGDHWQNLTHHGGYPAKPFPWLGLSDPKPFAQLRYSPTASTIFWSRPGEGISYSYDGSNFIQVPTFPGGITNPDNFITSICADDSTGYVYFSTFFEDVAQGGHIYRSTAPWTATTPCLSFELVNTGLPNQSRIESIAWALVPNRLAIAMEDPQHGIGTRIYTSTTGTSWVPCPVQPSSVSWDARPLICPNPNQIIVGTVVPFVSNDWGSSWTDLSYTGMHGDIRNFYTGSYPAANLLWMVTDGGSTDGSYGNVIRWSFSPGNNPTSHSHVPVLGMKTWQCYFMAATGTAGGSRRRIYLGSIDNGCLVSDDNGVTWQSNGAPPGDGCGDYISLVFAPNNPNRAYVRGCNGTYLRRADNAFSAATPQAVTWVQLAPPGGNGLPQVWTNNVTSVDPSNGDRVCIARNLDLAISTNAGANWTSRSLPDGAQPISVFLDAGSTVFAGTRDHGIYQSPDNGATWVPFGLNDGSIGFVLKVIHTTAGGGAGTYFAATEKGLYRKLPGGNFTYVNTGGDAGYTVTDIEVDPNCSNRIYVAKGFAGIFVRHRGGVLLSEDNGNSFTSITAGLDIHQGPVTDIQVDPVSSQFLNAATYGIGGWRWDAGAVPACH